MKVRVLGGGWYGCHITRVLLDAGLDVELHEISDRLFSGASGSNPARLHLGFHYPRSHLTRAACQDHHRTFMEAYGHLTRAVPINIYAVAEDDSWVDFGTYLQVLRSELELVRIPRPEEFGLQNVEGAVLTGERHIVIDQARRWFAETLVGHTRFGQAPGDPADPAWDWTIDCTFCANDARNIERFEPCITALLRGPTDRAVTIMDGPFPSLYPWSEDQGLCSLTSAKFTPLARCDTHAEALAVLQGLSRPAALERCWEMIRQLRHYYPAVDLFELDGFKLGIRAQPRSGSAARLVDVVRIDERVLRVRAGKIDAIDYAANLVKGVLCSA